MTKDSPKALTNRPAVPRHPPLMVRQPAWRKSTGIALTAVVLASLTRWAMNPLVDDRFPFLTFFFAVGFSAWYGGRWAGIVALAAGGVIANWFFFVPLFEFNPFAPGAGVPLLVYALVGSGLVAMFESRRRAWLTAAEQVNLLQVTLGSIGDGVITTDADLRVTHLNPSAERLTGWTCKDAVGRNLDAVMEVVDGTTGGRAELVAVKAAREGMRMAPEQPGKLRRRDGSKCWIEESAAPLPCQEGNGCVIVLRDVTDRCRAQREAETSLAKTELVADAVPALISYVSADYRYQLNNKAYETWFARPRSDFHGRTMEEVLGSGAWEKLRPHVDKVLRGEAVSYEAEVPYRDGGSRWIAAAYTPDLDKQGKPRGFVAHVTDISAHKRAELALQESEERLREADRRKDEFLATLAHELRNPLAPARNALEILRRGDDPQLRDKALASVERQIAHMVRLIDDLLDVSRINSGRLELRKEPTDLHEVIRHAVDACRPAFAKRAHRFECVLPEEPVVLEADPVRLTQVVGNLLNNAAKYTDPQGNIRLEVERDGDDVRVRVTDSGIGIPREKLAKVFELFTQLDSSLEKSADGLGIGLSLVKQLVEMHGGRVTVDSAGPGRGSEFVCHLPVSSRSANATPASAAPAGSFCRSAPLRILVVDDNRDSAESLALLLGLDGHDMRCAHDGHQAVELAGDFRPDVVILDIGLPGMNGLDACRAIRTAEWGRSIFIVALTGWGQEEDQRKTRDAGFDAHLVKPVEPGELSRLLGALTEGKPAPVR